MELRLRFAVAGALILGPAAFCLHALQYKPPHHQEPASFGVVPPLDARPGRGMVMGVAVDVTGCDRPVTVTVVAAGTAEYWLDQGHRLDSSSPIKLLLPGAHGERLTLTVGHAARDALLPPPSSQMLASDSSVRVTRTEVLDRDRPDYASVAVTANVRNWGATFAPIVARYKTHSWLSKRGLGSCYLRLPTLTGDRSMLASQQADQRANSIRGLLPAQPTRVVVFSTAKQVEAPYRPGVGAQAGHLTARMGRASVAADESLPTPDQRFDGHATWTCRAHARRTSVIRPDTRRVPGLLIGRSIDSPGAFSLSALRDAASSDCSAIAVLVESNAASRRDTYLLVTGALLGLGLALLCETLLARVTRRREEAGAPRADAVAPPGRPSAPERATGSDATPGSLPHAGLSHDQAQDPDDSRTAFERALDAARIEAAEQAEAENAEAAVVEAQDGEPRCPLDTS